MNSFIKSLKEMAFGKPTEDEKYEHITYTFESIYPDIETMERIENNIRQKKRETEREE